MKINILLAILLLAPLLSEAKTQPEGIDSTLFSYYERCSKRTKDSSMLLTIDSMFQLAIEKDDSKMQCVALTFKADYYYFNNNLDSLKAWIPRVQKYARAKDQLMYYYFVWSRLIVYYTKHTQYTLAQYELQQYMEQAQKDQYKAAVADGYIQLANIYSSKVLLPLAAEYYAKAIEFIEENDINKFQLCAHYTSLAGVYIEMNQYDKAAQAIEQGKKAHVVPSQIWALHLQEARLLINTGELKEAELLVDQIKKNGSENVSQSAILELEIEFYIQVGALDKALSTTNQLISLHKREAKSERYYQIPYASRALIYAKKQNFKAAYEDLNKYLALHQQKVMSDNESTLSEFATLLDVNRLDQEKYQIRQQAQAEKIKLNTVIICCLVAILLLATTFIFILIRFNRRLREAKRAAEESNRMKGIFIRTITHEINTPLNAIVGFSEQAATLPPEEEEDRLAYIEIIRKNSNHLQKLVEDTLYISDLESSEAPPVIAPVDINDCGQQCIQKTSPLCYEGVEMRFSPGCEQLTVTTSRLYLYKALTELLQNATRFTNQGVITLSYSLSDNRQSINFFVTDTGCGIPATEKDRIFERFVKLDSFGQGMGLGLTVCQLIAKSLQGNLKLDTQYTEGARFVLSIPVH